MPVCEGCGGSFDESFRFCPYCGRAKPEPEVIKVEVSVSSDEKWETCEIRQAIFDEDNMEALNKDLSHLEDGYFWADGIEPNGFFFAGESPIFRVIYGREDKYHKWEVRRDGSRPAHNFLVNQLIKNGWEPDESFFGENWWQKRFRRRYGKEYAPSWTTWEIYVEVRDSVGYFVIRGAPSGNEKITVKRNTSREFKVKSGFFSMSDHWTENPEKRQILKEFLAELKSQGYKLVSSSENESLKKCYWSEIQYSQLSWYFQILMKEEWK